VDPADAERVLDEWRRDRELAARGELFGHRPGAFASAAVERAGPIRSADHGTLLLARSAVPLRAPSVVCLTSPSHRVAAAHIAIADRL